MRCRACAVDAWISGTPDRHALAACLAEAHRYVAVVRNARRIALEWDEECPVATYEVRNARAEVEAAMERMLGVMCEAVWDRAERLYERSDPLMSIDWNDISMSFDVRWHYVEQILSSMVMADTLGDGP